MLYSSGSSTLQSLRCSSPRPLLSDRRSELFRPAKLAVDLPPRTRRAMPAGPMTAFPRPIAGIDFGTSNSAVAIAHPGEAARFAEFSLLGRSTQSYRSLLFFDPDDQDISEPIEYSAGTAGIAAYLDAVGDGRLIQSFKTHLTTRALGRTKIGPHALDLDGLLTLFLRRLEAESRASLGTNIERAVFGRPVRFAGAKEEADNARAETRLRAAAAAAGIKEVFIELEPIAAAYHYESRLASDETAMIADFGGGTTDFCIMQIGPSRREQRDRSADILATGGIGIAGDDLDAALIQNVVAPALGKGTHYHEFGKTMVIPPSYYNKLSHWHQLSFLRGDSTRGELERLRKLADDPEAIDALIDVIDDNQGFHLHESVEKTKIALSTREAAQFEFNHDNFDLNGEVTRSDFEDWIAPEVAEIARALDETLATAGLQPAQIDRVFMTGGTAFVPCVRRQFAERFGGEKLSSGDELFSIASGLAARGARLES